MTANSHMSDISLQLPASAHVSTNNSALVKFSQAGSDPMQHVHSLQPIPNQTRMDPWRSQYPTAYRQGFTGSSRTSRNCSNESAKRFDVLYSINKDNFLLPLISTKRLRGKTLSILWREVTQYTITICKCMVGNSHKKQMPDFPKY